jgi:hypothetical protein
MSGRNARQGNERQRKPQAIAVVSRRLAFTSPLSTCQKRAQTSKTDDRRRLLKPDEIRKLDAYFKRVFQNPKLEVKARPRKDDSAEVYVGDEFLGIVFKDEDDGDYNFSMAILDIDLA